MEQTTPKIELYVTRTFTEKLSTAFGFLRRHTPHKHRSS